MLAQNFKTAAELNIDEGQLAALIKTLVLLETNKLQHVPPVSDMEGPGMFSGHFNMSNWRGKHACGTIACIGGTAEIIGNVSFGFLYDIKGWNWNLSNLFLPSIPPSRWGDITPDQAATALRSYLTTGDARWDMAVAP